MEKIKFDKRTKIREGSLPNAFERLFDTFFWKKSKRKKSSQFK